MNLKRWSIIVLVSVAVGVCLLLIRTPQPKLPPGSAAHEATGEEKNRIVAAYERGLAGRREYLAAYERPLDVYGVVLEQQTQQPIAGATVQLDPVSNPGFDARQPAPTFLETDARGRFSFTGHHGHALVYGVRKEGYYFVQGRSGGMFSYDSPQEKDGIRAFAPDPAQPARLYLRQQGVPAAKLIKHGGSHLLPADGSPMQIKLEHNMPVPIGLGDLQVECTGNDVSVLGGTPFNWSCRISVPGGGLQERKDEFVFQAPEEGYQSSVEVNMPASLGKDGWQRGYKRECFFRLGNGCYARGEIDVHPGGKHLVYFDYFYNPTPIDRNLEASSPVESNH